MKVKILLFSLLMVLAVGVRGQELTKKQIKAQKEQAQKDEVVQLIASKQFVFTPSSATANNGKNINLTSSYTLTLNVDSASAYLPFYGRAYAGTSYGGDGGIEFKNAITDYKVTDMKKGTKSISFQVEKNNEPYKVSLSISVSGYTNVTIIPQNRSMMSYYGTISKIKEEK